MNIFLIIPETGDVQLLYFVMISIIIILVREGLLERERKSLLGNVCGRISK